MPTHPLADAIKTLKWEYPSHSSHSVFLAKHARFSLCKDIKNDVMLTPNDVMLTAGTYIRILKRLRRIAFLLRIPLFLFTLLSSIEPWLFVLLFYIRLWLTVQKWEHSIFFCVNRVQVNNNKRKNANIREILVATLYNSGNMKKKLFLYFVRTT